MTELYIKNMVCKRCIAVVEEVFRAQGIEHPEVQLGHVNVRQAISPAILPGLKAELSRHGFELLNDSKTQMIERIKNVIISRIHHSEALYITVNWSALLSEELRQDYNSLSALFSSVEGLTVEQYIIRQKIERVKELLFYDELNLSEIAYKMGYSSVQHLSTQFKKVTGQTPSRFKLSREIERLRRPLDSVG